MIAEELRSLSIRYAAGVDRRDRELLLSVFHPNATLLVVRPTDDPERPRRPLTGHAEISKVFERLAVYDQTMHVVSQAEFVIRATGPGGADDGAPDDVASGEVTCVAHHRWTEGADELDHVMYIRYSDEYRLGDDLVWRIDARRVGVEWSETRVIDAPGRTPH